MYHGFGKMQIFYIAIMIFMRICMPVMCADAKIIHISKTLATTILDIDT